MSKTKSLLDTGAMAAASARELLATYESLLGELRRREVTRTNDAPSGQYAEWLACRVFRGTLAPNSVKSYDLTDNTGRRIQVKSRVVRDATKNPARQLSPFRSFEFDDALIILFDGTYKVRRAVLLSAEAVQQQSTHRAHVNGHVLVARDSVLDLGEDVTGRFVDVA